MIKRIMRAAWRGLFRDGGLAAATIFVLTLTISLASFLLLSRNASNFLIGVLQEKADIAVYFKESAQEDEILTLKEEISKIPEVKDIDYVSSQEALESFAKRYENNEALMEAVQEAGGNPFLASLNVKAWQASQYTAITGFLESGIFSDSIEKIDYYERQTAIDRIFSLSSFINKSGISLSFILIIIAVLLAFNTIKLAIYNSNEEIKIQRLVGASNWFLRGPFLAQGAIAGIFSALISLLVLAMASWFVAPKLEFLFSGLNIFSLFVANFWVFFLLQILAGLNLGVLSSLLAIRKYLKV